MEDNTTKTPLCVKGCGFFGNPTTNNMCSKCFKGTSNKNGQNANNITSTTSTNQINLPLTTKFEGSSAQTNTTATAEQVVPLTTTTITANNGESVAEVITTTTTTTTTTASTSLQPSTAIISSSPDARPIQKNKASCYTCRAKIPLAKQTINKCRCEYVYCDNHKVPNKHDCDFDFAKMGKDILAKNNPKLNDVHKGGRSFNRID